MKTGFIQGFVNLMKPVTYPYHGILNQCGKQPEIPPYMGPDMKPVGQEWVLVYEGSCGTTWRKYFTFWPMGFLKSSDDYLCPDGSVGEKNTYYFTEVYLWQRAYNENMNITWSDGVDCKASFIPNGNYLYIYKAWFNIYWVPLGILWRCYNTGPSSTCRVWKSLTGEFPGYYPFPQKEIIRV